MSVSLKNYAAVSEFTRKLTTSKATQPVCEIIAILPSKNNGLFGSFGRRNESQRDVQKNIENL